MKKTILCLLAAVLVLGVMIVSCTSEEAPAPTPPAPSPAPSPAPQPTPPPAPAMPEEVIFVSGPVSSSSYPLHLLCADLVSRYTDIRAFNLPTSTHDITIIDALGEGLGDVGTCTGDTSAYAFIAEIEPWTEKGPREYLRLLMACRWAPFAFMVRGDSGIETMDDLRGKTVVTEFAFPTSTTKTRGLLMACGIDPDTDVKPYRVGDSSEAGPLLIEGKIDAFLDCVPAPLMRETAMAVDGYCIPVDKEILENLDEYMPGFGPMFNPAGSVGCPTDRWLPGVPSHMPVNASMSDEAAYAMVKAITEHYDDHLRANALMAEFDLAHACTTYLPIPYHPGSVKYFKEMGVWTDDLEARQAALLEKAAELAKK